MQFKANITMMKKVKVKKMKDKLSLKEMLKINNRALRILSKRYPQMVSSTMASSTWNALSPYVNIYISATIINELAGNRDIDKLKKLVMIALILTALIALVAAFLKKWKESQNAGMWEKIEKIFAEKMLDMDYASLDDIKTSEKLSTIRQNMNGGGWGLIRVIECYELLYTALITVIGGISLTVSLFTSMVPKGSNYAFLNDPLIVIFMIILMLSITIAAPILNNKAESYFAKYANYHNLGNRLFSFFSWLGFDEKLATDVRIYRQDRICNRYNSRKDDTFASDGLFAHLARGPIGLYAAASSAISIVFTGVVYLFVCLKALGGAFGLGSITQYISSITKVSTGIANMLSTLGEMANNALFIKLNLDFLDISNDMYKGSLTVEKRRDRKYQVEFRHVSFKYPGSDNYAVNDVNMKFEIGKRLAVVGMNGSGKTTFIKLLCRLYDPTEGEILLNGIDIRKYNYREYMDIFAVVFQDFKLLSLKLGENVASNIDYDKDKVVDCLNKAGFADRLDNLPDGLETYLYKEYHQSGIEVSGGEAQKIAIARALYKDAPFIILDEPTAALDPLAEEEIYNKFNDIAGDKTAVYISHRLSSCKFCDEIVVFHEGRVIQQGNHEQLLADENGKYHELWHAQAQYYAKIAKVSIS